MHGAYNAVFNIKLFCASTLVFTTTIIIIIIIIIIIVFVVVIIIIIIGIIVIIIITILSFICIYTLLLPLWAIWLLTHGINKQEFN
jgi:hypothetical protein